MSCPFSLKAAYSHSPLHQAPKLDFRHSDNINHFVAFVRFVGLPEVRWNAMVEFYVLKCSYQGFVFELTDLYEKKNFPKVIYCIHALRSVVSRSIVL